MYANEAVPTNIDDVSEFRTKFSEFKFSPLPPPPNIVTNTPSEPDGVTSTPEPVK